MSLKLYRRGEIWHYRGTIGPAEKRIRLGGSCKTGDRDTAARQVAEIEARYWKGCFDGPGAILTFGRAAVMYRAAGKSGRFLAKVERYLENMLVDDITPGVIRQMAMELYPACSGASKNRLAIGPAQAVINFAAESELCRPIKIKRFKVEAKIKEPVTASWLHKFGAHTTEAVRAIAWFMFFTGARVGEAVGMQWEDVDLVGQTALIRQPKVGVERKAHLPRPMIAMLASLPRIEGRGVFVYQHPDDLMAAWDGAIKRAGIKRLTPHSCRHGFATELLHRGIDPVTVARLGGWRSPLLVLNVYGHAMKKRDLTDILIDTELAHEEIELKITKQ